MLGDVGAYDEWLERERPSEAAQRIAAFFIGRINLDPCEPPSIPVDVSDQPRSQVRTATLPIPGEPTDFRVRYRHFYGDGTDDLVDLIDVTNQAPVEHVEATAPDRRVSGMIVLVTGIMASGKSTVAQLLAKRFERAVHLRGDLFRRAIVSGRQEMSPDPSPEALAQLRLRYRLTAQAADAYASAGFTTVVQDTILGPMLAEMVALFHHPVQVVVLAPSADEVARREGRRAKTGYRSFTPTQLDRVLREETPRIGTWIDSTDQTPDETVEAIVRRLRAQ